MKKFFALLLVCLMVGSFAACKYKTTGETPTSTSTENQMLLANVATLTCR